MKAIIFILAAVSATFVFVVGALTLVAVLFGETVAWTPVDLAGTWGMIFVLYCLSAPSVLRTATDPE